MSTPDIDPQTDMGPGALLNKDGNYCLQHEDIVNLLRFVWSGYFIPTDKTALEKVTGLVDKDYNDLKTLIDPVLTDYTNVQKHCQVFKDVTYPHIVQIADSIYDYAQNASGDDDSSYYAQIFINVRNLAAEKAKPIANQNKQSIDDMTGLIKGLCDAQVQAIDALKSDAENVAQSLRDFETEVKSDQNSLTTSQGAITRKLSGEGGDIKTLQDRINTNVQTISDDEDERTHDIVVAATAVTYAWIVPIGTICAAAVMGVYSDKAIKMLHAIEALQDLVDQEKQTLSADKALVSGLTLVDNSVTGVLSMIGPAITAIEGMIGVWDSIGNDLKAVSAYVDKDIRKASAALTPILQKNVVKKWTALMNSVDKYRKAAFVTDVEKTTLQQYADDIKKLPKA